jgi:nitroimidazol reductase NimA-like FMN-containing flavoprotein (pyridoxamine 5'-phosphate oxidase superfamily)
MAEQEPRGLLDARYSAADATATSWAEARQRLAGAELYWLTTIRPDGRPHIIPLIAVWLDGALHWCTGPHEQKVRNLAANPRCALTTGTNTLSDGYDLVIEGEAVRVTDDAELARIADAYTAKYGPDWHFTVSDGHLHSAGGPAVAYRVAPVTAYGFGKTTPSQTRWTFDPGI